MKQQKKQELADYLEKTQDLILDPKSIYDIQIKRLHEYKRQQMNALYVIYKYLKIKGGEKPKTPITMIFGAKAAPAYLIAKDIIHLILCLQELISNDPEVSPYLKVVMVENYNVTMAEHLIPACDISRADFPGVQGGVRHRKHEVYAEWSSYPGNRGRSKCRNPRTGRR